MAGKFRISSVYVTNLFYRGKQDKGNAHEAQCDREYISVRDLFS